MRRVLEFEDAFLKNSALAQPLNSSNGNSVFHQNSSIVEQTFESMDPKMLRSLTDDEQQKFVSKQLKLIL